MDSAEVRRSDIPYRHGGLLACSQSGQYSYFHHVYRAIITTDTNATIVTNTCTTKIIT